MTLCILLTLLSAILFIDALVVALSYSMCWYEYANANPQLMSGRFSPGNLWKACALCNQELFFNFVTILVLPFGLFPPRKAPQAKGETPVLLLHGLFNNRASWFWFKWSLRRQGFKNLVTINLSSWHNEEVLTELVAKKVDELRHSLGVDRVHLLGHSMGGIIARNYLQLRGGAGKVANCVCLGSPHAGSKLAPFAVSPLGQVLIPGSEFLKRLAAAPPAEGVRMTNVYTCKDNMVVPNEAARLHWGENLLLDNMGHTALLYRRPALKAAITGLLAGSE